jgi:RHS repeat-associated protein
MPTRPALASLFLLLVLPACGDDPVKKPNSPPGAAGDAVETLCDDGLDNDGDGHTDCDDLDCRVAGGACTLAPGLDRSVATTVAESARFLYTGQDPIQKDADAAAFDARRVAILRGSVVDRRGAPLPGVRVSISGHAEFGYTLSRPDGLFDLAVNGGGRLVLDYEKDGFLHAERVAQPGWQRYGRLPEVGLVEESSKGSSVAAGASRAQVLLGERVEDEFGARQPLVVFAPGTKATLELEDETTEPLSSFTVRITEYPLETGSVERWVRSARFAPGTLPVTGGIHYGLEFTVEEARALGARKVGFSKPVALYVENFLGLPVGAPVPLGYYDRTSAGWETAAGGRVVRVLGVDAGEAELDFDGDGVAESDDVLESFHVTSAELAEVARHYEAGATLWRAAVTHFSPWDMLIPVSAPVGATPPTAGAIFSRPLDVPSRRGSSVVETRAATHTVPIAGTPFSLHYQTDRTTAYRQGFQLEIPVTGDTLPEGFLGVLSVVDIAGREFEEFFEAAPNQKHVVVWDGTDAFGRLLQGPQTAEVLLVNVFDGRLAPSNVFGSAGAETESSATNLPSPFAFLVTEFEKTMGVWDAKGYELGGFSLDVLHAYDPAHQTVFFGWGDQRTAQNVALVVTQPAQDFDLGTPDGVTVAPDGSAIVTDDQQFDDSAPGRILRIDRDGAMTVLAGPGASGPAGDLELGSPQGIVVRADGTLIVSDFLRNAVREIAPDGSVRTLVGALSADKPLVRATVGDLDGIALGPREELYIVNANQVLKLEAGVLTTFAGGGTGGDDVPATETALVVPSGVVAAPDGSVFISERGVQNRDGGHRIRKVTPDGIIRTVAGTGVPGFSGDGGAATSAQLHGPRGLALATDGTLYVADQVNNRIRRITPDGIIQTVAGGGDATLQKGQLAQKVRIDLPDGIAFGSDGALWIATEAGLFRVAPGLPELSDKESLIPSTDGRTLYQFDHRGKHQATLDAMTGVTELSFRYNAAGLLTQVRDKNGLTTAIERDAAGLPTAVIAPFGQRTELSLNDTGFIQTVTDALGRKTELGYGQGLLERVRDPIGGEQRFEYDSGGLGLLERATDPTGYSETFVTFSTLSRYAVGVTTPEGRLTEYALAPGAAGTVERSLTLPNNAVLRWDDALITKKSTAPDGTTVMTGFAPDLFFGGQSLFPEDTTVTTPAGRTLSLDSTRLKQFTDDDNALSLEQWDEVVELNGRVFSSTFTRTDRTVTTVSAMGRSGTTKLDELGRPFEATSPGRGRTTWTYDDLGRVTSITRTAGSATRVQSFEYGMDGFLATRTNAKREVTTEDRDVVGRLLGITRPDTNKVSWELDDRNNLLSLTPPRKKPHVFLYQGASDLLVATIPPAVTGATPSGLPIGETHYHHDSDLALTKIERSDARDLSFGYDPISGQLKTVSFPGAEIQYSYEPSGKLTAVNRTDSVRVAMTHDGPLWTGSTWTGAIEGKVSANYDDSFQLSALTVNDASTVSFGYDGDGLVTSAVGNGVTMTVSRDAASGFPTGTAIGTVSTSQSYNGFGELTSLAATFQNQIGFSQAIERDELGRVVHITETQGSLTRELFYEYDALGRLIAAERDGVVTTYAYDPNGNRSSVSVDGVEVSTASYDAQDRIVDHGPDAFEQSANGDLVRRTSDTRALELTYDALGNLLTASVADELGARNVDYFVDGFGRRVAKRVGGSFSRAWLYRDALRPVAEIDSDGVFSHFVYTDGAGGAPDFILRAGVPLRVIKDQLGSVRFVVNAQSGVVEQRLEYDEFGRVLEDSRPGFQPFGFAGGLYDPDTGLVRFGARDYDPETGRWAAKDPIGFAGGDTNVYVYCGNDPVNFVDLDGLRPLWKAEIDFLRRYFGDSLDYESIDVQPTAFVDHPWSPYESQIHLPAKYFVNNDPRQMVRLAQPRLAAVFAHEALHVWQRQHGRSVTREGAWEHAFAWLMQASPYSYRIGGNASAMLAEFLTGGVEQQGRVVQDLVFADLTGNVREHARYRLVLWHIQHP